MRSVKLLRQATGFFCGSFGCAVTTKLVQEKGDMMKRTEILPALEKLFTNPPFTITNTYKVCWLDGKIDLISTSCPLHPEIVFGIVHKSDIKDGLTPGHWARIESKILSFLTQKGLM